MPVIHTLGHDDAMRAIEAIRVELVRRNDTAVVAVGDVSGELIALLRLDGAPLSAVPVAINKSYTAARTRGSTRVIGDAIRDTQRGVAAKFYGDDRFVGWAGGLPVQAAGVVIGAVGVSGMSQALDEELAGIGVAAIVNHPKF